MGDDDGKNIDDSKAKNKPHWAVNLMQNFYESKKWFNTYHFFRLAHRFACITDTKLVGIVLTPDVRLGYENKEILTPNVKVVFLQIFSVTQRELDWL